MIGKYCIARTYSAGVHFGIVSEVEGTRVLLRASKPGEQPCKGPRRLWRWTKHFTLTGVALHGPGEDAKISEAAPGDLYLSEVIELIEVCERARTLLEKHP